MVIRKGKVKLNLSILFDFAQGHCFVAVFSWDFCHDKILSSEGFLQISTWAKNLIMDKTPRVFIVVEFCCGGLRPESSLFFSCCNLFLGIMISFKRLGYWRGRWYLCLCRPTILRFWYAGASGCFLLNSLLICKAILWFYNKI